MEEVTAQTAFPSSKFPGRRYESISKYGYRCGPNRGRSRLFVPNGHPRGDWKRGSNTRPTRPTRNMAYTRPTQDRRKYENWPNKVAPQSTNFGMGNIDLDRLIEESMKNITVSEESDVVNKQESCPAEKPAIGARKSWTELLHGQNCTLAEIDIKDVSKESDESTFTEEDCPYTEESPLDAGWEYGIFMGARNGPVENSSQIELYTINGVIKICTLTKYLQPLGDSIYVRYQKDSNNNYKVFPSRHRHSIVGTMKIRPNKSLEIRPIAVVAFSRDVFSPIPVWSDIVGWRTIDYRHLGVFRKGLIDMGQEEIFKPLRLIEFTIKIRIDIDQAEAEFIHDAVKISDVAPLSYTSSDEVDIPECCYPKSPKRISDLSFTKYSRDLEARAIFSSKSYPKLNFWSSADQCAYTEKEMTGNLSGIFVPTRPNEYRALLVAPIQRLHQITKGHFMDYKQLPSKTFRIPTSLNTITMVRSKRKMGISDNDVQKQLRHMMAFIEQEANEKAEEIDAKAEEEFNIEKGRLVQQQRQKIMEFYEKKEKQVELQRKIQASNSLNAGRLMCLKAREDHIRHVLDEAKGNLSRISAEAARYPAILKGLIMQGLLQLLEKEVVLRCREKDLSLVEQLLPECLNALQQQWGDKTHITIDKNNFLPSNSAGGVEISAKAGKIRVSSTLESRLELIAGQIVPQIRTALFGPNPNRKFFD